MELLEGNPSKFRKREEKESHFFSRFLLLPEIPAICLGPIMYILLCDWSHRR